MLTRSLATSTISDNYRFYETNILDGTDLLFNFLKTCILGFHYEIMQLVWVDVNLNCIDAYAVLE